MFPHAPFLVLLGKDQLCKIKLTVKTNYVVGFSMAYLMVSEPWFLLYFSNIRTLKLQ